MVSFCGIRSKMYSYEINRGKTVQKAKGVTKSVVERCITHQDYVDCLFNKQIERHQMECIRSDKHALYLKSINKITLSPYDNKRWVRASGIDTYAYGDYRINTDS